MVTFNKNTAHEELVKHALEKTAKTGITEENKEQLKKALEEKATDGKLKIKIETEKELNELKETIVTRLNLKKASGLTEIEIQETAKDIITESEKPETSTETADTAAAAAENTPDANSTDTVPDLTNAEPVPASTSSEGEEKPKNGLENMMKWLGGVMGALGAAFQTLMKYFGQAKEMFASSMAGFENVDQYKNFNTLRSAIGNPDINAKLETLDAQQKKEIISALQSVVGDGKQVSSQKLKKLFERKPFSSNAEGTELANELIDHLEKNKLEYEFEEKILSPEEEKEKAEKEAEEKKKSFIDSVNKEMIDGASFVTKKIDTDFLKENTYPDFSNPANMKSFGSPKPWKEYTVWEINKMQPLIDTSKANEQEIRVINLVAEYFKSLSKEQQGQIQGQTLASIVNMAGTPPEKTETVTIDTIREKASKLNKKEKTSSVDQKTISELYKNNPDEFILDSATDKLPIFRDQNISRDLFTKNLRDLGIVIPEGTNYEKINGVYKKYSPRSTLSAIDRKFS